jgi:hypothetical protein
MEAIQQAAQDSGYVYDSSVLPWETEEHSFALLRDADDAERRKKAKEEQPGALFFHKQPTERAESALSMSDPYLDGLVVFVVGEEPTSGVHKKQFTNSVQWIKALQPAKPTKILGPTFSGSLVSLKQLLSDGELAKDLKSPVSVYSGGVTSETMVNWFTGLSSQHIFNEQVKFRSFQESDKVMIDRYRSYLCRLGVPASRLAIISEDETAFGGYSDEDCGEDPHTHAAPTCLYYPRDISSLRDAYQKQSIFNTGLNGQGNGTARRSLSTDIADPEQKDHDTIRSYSGNQSALSQEAVLQQIVSFLRAHESQYLVLRSSNPLDQLFLSHFFSIAYPEGRIVIQGADLLMRRETGAAALSGIMTLTTYPLLPWENHWTHPYPPDQRGGLHAHKVFSEDIAEGTYIATRFLVSDNVSLREQPDDKHSKYFLPETGLLVRDYAPPFWLSPSLSVWQCPPWRPATWLSVLGRQGFWPVAAFSGAAGRAETECSCGRNTDVAVAVGQGETSVWSELGLGPPTLDSTLWAPEYHKWPGMPISMKVGILTAWALMFFHLYCCCCPSLTLRPAYRAYFVRMPGNSHIALVVFGSVMVCFFAILLGWGYGAMSLTGEPVCGASWYRVFLPATWLICGLAVYANAWVESAEGRKESAEGRKWGLKDTGWPLLSYFGGTIFLFLLIKYFLDAGLTPDNRIPTYWRAMALTSGVSPLIPFLALAAGLYCWFWYSVQGLALFGDDRPRLPRLDDLKIYPDVKTDRLSMYSRERVADPIELLSDPLSKEFCFSALILMVPFAGAFLFLAGNVPLRTLGSQKGSGLFCWGLCICAVLMLTSAWQLLRVWLRLRQLLVFLDRAPFRRTIRALKGYSWGRVWRMSANVLDARYRLLSRQIENLTHLSNSCLGLAAGTRGSVWLVRIADVLSARVALSGWYGMHWDDGRIRDLKELGAFQKAIASAAGDVFANTLVDAWRVEKESLILGQLTTDGKPDAKEDKDAAEALTVPLTVRNAEELVALTYLGFVQNVLGRMRTLVMAIVCLFVATSISLAAYPFDPRPLASRAMLFLFLVLGAVIVVVYAQMHRDTTLSNVTDTTPGELGTEFWVKLIGFGVGPVLGLLATAFPELTGALLSWVQPGLDSMK